MKLCRPLALPLLLAAAALPIGQAGRAGQAQAAPPRLNVLFIMADDLRDYGGVFTRGAVKTPNLDRLRRRGVTFERAYAQYPVCNPSRISMLTGLRPEETGIVGNTVQFRTRMPEVVTLPQLFRQNGWHSASYGKIFHVGEAAGEVRAGWTDEGKSWDEARLFQPTPLGRKGEVRDLAPGKLTWCKVGEMDGADEDQADGQSAAAVVAAIEQQSEAGKLWFIGAGFHRPHDPFLAPRKYYRDYPREKLQLYRDPEGLSAAPPMAIPKGWDQIFADFTETDRRDFLRAYMASTTFMDAQLGKLLDMLDRRKLWDRTVVVFMGDHGFHLGERGWWNKNTLFERSCRAPLIIAAPGTKRGERSLTPVEFLDLYPTLAELAGLTAPHRLSGKSLAPLLASPKAGHKDAAFTLVTRGARWGQSVRTQRWRFTRWSDGRVELYDHDTDPEEVRDLSERPENAGVVAELTGRLKTLPPWPQSPRPQ